jgi:hypothetical protein
MYQPESLCCTGRYGPHQCIAGLAGWIAEQIQGVPHDFKATF